MFFLHNFVIYQTMTDCESICYGSIQEKTHGVSNLIFPINLAIKLVIVETQPFIENFPIKTTHTVWYFPLQSLIHEGYLGEIQPLRNLQKR